MMMKRDGNLNQSLQKLLFRPARFTPHVFPNLVRVEKMPLVEQPNPAPVAVFMHGQILAATSVRPTICDEVIGVG